MMNMKAFDIICTIMMVVSVVLLILVNVFSMYGLIDVMRGTLLVTFMTMVYGAGYTNGHNDVIDELEVEEN